MFTVNKIQGVSETSAWTAGYFLGLIHYDL